jgi:hypothetical protein
LPLRPGLLALDGKGRRAAALLFRRKADSPDHVIVMDDDCCERLSVPNIDSPVDGSVPFACVGPAGDGPGTLVFLAEGRARAVRADGAALWADGWPLPTDPRALLDVQPAAGDRPAVVWVRTGPTVYGLAAPTGRPLWRCDGPGDAEACLLPDRAGEPPRVLFSLADDTLVCRVALPTRPTGEYRPAPGGTRSYDPAPDPRRERFLPWRQLLFPPDSRVKHREPEEPLTRWEGDAPSYAILLSLLFGLVYWRIPFTLARLARRRRSWLLALVPLFWLWVAVYFTATRRHASDLVRFTLLGLAGLLVLSLATWAAGSLRRRRWRRVAVAAALLLLLTAASAVPAFLLDRPRMAPWEHYAWRDAALLPVLWLYVLGLLLCLGRFFWWLLGPRPKRQPQPTTVAA